MLAGLEKVTGVRQTTCPWQALRDPFVIAVLHGHRAYKERQLFQRMPRCPEALVRGIEAYDAALNAVMSHDMRLERERLDRENEERAREFAGSAMRGPNPVTLRRPNRR